MLAHVTRHAIGYATILGSMIAVAAQRVADPAPFTQRAEVSLVLAVAGAACSTVVAYRARPPVPLNATPPQS